MHVLAPGADACQSQRLVTTVEIIQQLTGNPGHSNVLISVLHCRVFQLLKQACMQRGLLPKKHMVSHVQSTNSLNHSHSLFVSREFHYAQAACTAEHAYSTVSASML